MISYWSFYLVFPYLEIFEFFCSAMIFSIFALFEKFTQKNWEHKVKTFRHSSSYDSDLSFKFIVIFLPLFKRFPQRLNVNEFWKLHAKNFFALYQSATRDKINAIDICSAQFFVKPEKKFQSSFHSVCF